METVSLTRRIAAPPDRVRRALESVGPLTRAADFDEVTVDGDELTIRNGVGVATVELRLRTFDDPDAALAYRQEEGIFESMETRFEVRPADGETAVTARTTFALAVSLVGPLLDATVVRRRRRRELSDQLDWLESRVVD